LREDDVYGEDDNNVEADEHDAHGEADD